MDVVAFTGGFPVAAELEMLNVAVSDVPGAFQLTLLNVTPLQVEDKVAPARLVPVSVTLGLVPCAPLLGLTLVMVGAPGLTTVTLNT
jgi:hypothetical protein